MDTRESATPTEKKEHVLGQRQPERQAQPPAHLQPEARRPGKRIHKLLPIVVSVLAVALALIIIVGIVRGG